METRRKYFNIFHFNACLSCTVASDFNSRLILTRYYSYTMDTVIPSDINSFLTTWYYLTFSNILCINIFIQFNNNSFHNLFFFILIYFSKPFCLLACFIGFCIIFHNIFDHFLSAPRIFQFTVMYYPNVLNMSTIYLNYTNN